LLQNDVHDMLQAGDRAPDLTLTTLDGQPISLAETAWRGRHTALLVFLRHLG
jgi:peroxiredoxin